MIGLTAEQRTFLEQQLENFRVSHTRDELNPIHEAIQYKTPPPSLRGFLNEMEQLRNALGDSILIHEKFTPLLKLVLFTQRRALAAGVESRKAKTTNPEMIAYLESELAPFDELLSSDWLKAIVACPMPRLADYLTLEQVEANLQGRNVKLAARQFDEKFHLLQTPNLLVHDIKYYREASAARGNTVAVVYIDIDDFKQLNTKYGHHTIDANVLPVFMRCLEAFVVARGHAYRYGGDEYALLLANGQGAIPALQHLQDELRSLAYIGIEESTSVSIGLCTVTPECYLSDNAVVERANRAMRYAKETAKGGIASYGDARYDDADLIAISRTESVRAD
jgi:diguanylate cyclase (GGDEF)-like protein